MPMTAARGAAFLLAFALLAATGCQMFAHPGPTAVAQGRYFSTGNPDYDAFFVTLHRLQVELKDAPERVAEPGQALAKTLDVGVDAEEIKKALSRHASDLGGHQVKLVVQRPASADKPMSLRVTGNPSGDDAAFVKSVEDSLGKAADLKLTIDAWQKELDELPQQGSSLEAGVDAAFVGASPGTRTDVKNNLSDGQKIIVLLVSRSKEAESSNTELLDAIVGALGETPATSSDKATEPPPTATPSETHEKKTHKAPPPPAKPSRPASTPAPAKPAATKPAATKSVAAKPEAKPPEAKAPPKSAPAAEVPPAAKPTQGTAKPDFEP
jgi:hypothetical protein